MSPTIQDLIDAGDLVLFGDETATHVLTSRTLCVRALPVSGELPPNLYTALREAAEHGRDYFICEAYARCTGLSLPHDELFAAREASEAVAAGLSLALELVPVADSRPEDTEKAWDLLSLARRKAGYARAQESAAAAGDTHTAERAQAALLSLGSTQEVAAIPPIQTARETLAAAIRMQERDHLRRTMGRDLADLQSEMQTLRGEIDLVWAEAKPWWDQALAAGGGRLKQAGVLDVHPEKLADGALAGSPLALAELCLVLMAADEQGGLFVYTDGHEVYGTAQMNRLAHVAENFRGGVVALRAPTSTGLGVSVQEEHWHHYPGPVNEAHALSAANRAIEAWAVLPGTPVTRGLGQRGGVRDLQGPLARPAQGLEVQALPVVRQLRGGGQGHALPGGGRQLHLQGACALAHAGAQVDRVVPGARLLRIRVARPGRVRYFRA
jgi:hypothetical protein